MKYIVWGVLLFLIIGLGAVALQREDDAVVGQNGDGSQTSQVITDTYINRDVGFQLNYRSEPNGYVVVEEKVGLENVPHAVTVMLESEYQELLESTEAREGPPAISVVTYPNTDNMQSEAWALANTNFSNIGLKVGDISPATVGGASAIRYTADGLYMSDTVVVAHGGYVYVISGQYLEPSSTIKLDFQPFLNSFRFIPTDEQISSFEECAAAGYPIMESFPRQCRTSDGQYFVEEINEQNLQVN
jgi:hypothetical protein